MKILVIGSGGREHAICKALASAASKPMVYCAPGNAGIAQDVECASLGGFGDITRFCAELSIDLVIIGPEQPLVDGLSDHLRKHKVTVLGPSENAAALEGSKSFTKTLCQKYDIPTATSMTFDDAQSAISHVQMQGAPIVVKADGLAAGKGVTVAMTVQDAIEAVEDCFAGRFGDAGTRVVIEEYLEGEEVSFFALCDGDNAIYLGDAQDHKRAFDGDEGPNTGGMGTYSPAPIVDDAMREQIMQTIILPAIKGMKAQDEPYQGILFAGLMMTKDGPKLIEFNCRLGDPEAQVILPRIQNDMAELLYKAASEGVAGIKVEFTGDSAVCVVMATQGYPGDYDKGSVIRGLKNAAEDASVTVYHAGTREEKGEITAAGGRVLGVTATGHNFEAARASAYSAIKKIDWPQGFYRNDIGWRAMKTDR